MSSTALSVQVLDEDRSVLLVDDDENLLVELVELLVGAGYECVAARTTDEARATLAERSFCVVLAEMGVGGGAGLDLSAYVSNKFPRTATVLLTSKDDIELAGRALEVGAFGYVVKPFESSEILVNVANAFRRRAVELENRTQRERLEKMVKDRTAELWNAIAKLEQAEVEVKESREETVERLSIAAEFRDDDTPNHIQRMSRYCGLLAGLAGYDEQRRDLVRVASIMHDVGKIGIPDKILMKPGPLTEQERSVMETHAELGYKILAGSKSPFLDVAASIALTHHERFDGRGYPQCLKGEEIPLEGRIAAIADVFDALTSTRVYKEAYPIGRAVEVMRGGSGSQFDPDLLDLFLGALGQVLDIRYAYPENQD